MTTEGLDAVQTERALIDMAVETWRFARTFERVLAKLDAGDQSRYANQLRYFTRKVEEYMQAAGLKLISLEGQPLDVGMAASVLNLADFDPHDALFVDHMVEPIVMGPGGVQRQGTVVVRKAYL